MKRYKQRFVERQVTDAKMLYFVVSEALTKFGITDAIVEVENSGTYKAMSKFGRGKVANIPVKVTFSGGGELVVTLIRQKVPGMNEDKVIYFSKPEQANRGEAFYSIDATGKSDKAIITEIISMLKRVDGLF